MCSKIAIVVFAGVVSTASAQMARPMRMTAAQGGHAYPTAFKTAFQTAYAPKQEKNGGSWDAPSQPSYSAPVSSAPMSMSGLSPEQQAFMERKRNAGSFKAELTSSPLEPAASFSFDLGGVSAAGAVKSSEEGMYQSAYKEAYASKFGKARTPVTSGGWSEEDTSGINVLAVVMLSLIAGLGFVFVVVRSRRSASTVFEESLITNA
jgi:hypothetical protein